MLACHVAKVRPMPAALMMLALLGGAGPLPRPARPVAPVISAGFGNETARDRLNEAADVIRITGIRAGMAVADIGTGGGYYVLRVAPVVGPLGRVYAQDLSLKALDAVRLRVRAAGWQNVRYVQGRQTSARLPAASVDVALMVHMYHEIEQPYRLLDKLRASLKPGGRIAIVDVDRPSEAHGMPKALLLCEVKAVGFELVGVTDIAEAYVAVFRPGVRPDPASVRACRS
jgi:ubiquinone/menaquinone biosynthesis C-methylase UbiE